MQSPISSVFLAWLQEHGVIAHGIDAGFVDVGWRGVAATRELPAGTSAVRERCCATLGDSGVTQVHSFEVHSKALVAENTLIAGALLLQVPEAVLMTTCSAARDAVFGQALGRYARSLTPEQASLALCLFYAVDQSLIDRPDTSVGADSPSATRDCSRQRLILASLHCSAAI